MATDKAFKRIHELIRSLAEAEKDLERGRMDLERLDQACDDGRELYERFVVLRHKAREQYGRTPPAAAQALSMAAEPGEPMTIRLDTRSEIRQTSLIDAIAESEDGRKRKRKSSSKPKEEAPARPSSLGEKLEQAPIAQLSKAIALSQKFWFVAELFKGDREAYEAALAKFEEAGSLDKAQGLLDGIVSALDKDPDEEALNAFTELLQRRYP
ncbi:MAG: hypothetical protein KDB88_08760 [Flavobacteriales bacterium]|nr:hypothetical protein [Flavobacteriales bacterium]